MSSRPTRSRSQWTPATTASAASNSDPAGPGTTATSSPTHVWPAGPTRRRRKRSMRANSDNVRPRRYPHDRSALAGSHQVLRPGHCGGRGDARHRPLRVRPVPQRPHRIGVPDAPAGPARGLRPGRRGSGHAPPPWVGGRHGNTRFRPTTGREDGMTTTAPTTTANQRLLDWVEEVATLCQPDRVEWCDGSKQEYDRLCQLLVDGGTLTRLNDEKRP